MMYGRELFQIPYERPALDDAFALRLEDYQCENGGIVIANPNAPTGIRQSEEFLRAVIEANPNVVVIIDEAYADFSGYTALPLVDEYENVVVVQTFSKSRSMAGMRIGHAIGNAKLIKAMNDVRYSFNSYPMTRLSVALGVAALSDQDYFEETTAKIVATRERTKQALTELGFTFGDSMTNFIFATHKTVPATHLFEELRNSTFLSGIFPIRALTIICEYPLERMRKWIVFWLRYRKLLLSGINKEHEVFCSVYCWEA